MTATDHGYQIDDSGRICSPGKFEGELAHVPTLWERGLEGFADEDDEDAFLFLVSAEDRAEFEFLPRNCYAIRLCESDSGFVCAEYLTEDEYRDEAFARRFEQGTEGLRHMSTGLCSSCEDCQSAFGMSEAEIQAGLEDGTLCDEGGFSWHDCDWCGTTLGGDRYAAHAIGDDPEAILHFDVCSDCLMYDANGVLPSGR
jgi:hypothetical protein